MQMHSCWHVFSIATILLSFGSLACEANENTDEKYAAGQGYPSQKRFAGILVNAYSVASTTPLMYALDATLDERAQIRKLDQIFFGIYGAEKEAICKPFDVGLFDLKFYFERGIVGKSDSVQSLNETILSDIDSVFKTDRRKRRFREMYTQQLIMHRDLDTLMGLHKLKLTYPQYSAACKRSAEGYIKRIDTRFEYVAFLNFLVSEKHLTQKQVDDISGAKFEGVISKYGDGKGPIFRPASHIWYQDVPIRMLGNSRILAELKMTVEHFAEARKLRKELLETFSTPMAEKLVGAYLKDGDEKTAVKEMGIWREEVDTAIKNLLEPEQYKRFRQLHFQYNARRLRLNWCKYLAGEKFNWENRMRMELAHLQIESDCYWQAHQLKKGFAFLQELVGEKRAKNLCGRLELTPWMGAASAPEKDKEIRKRLQIQLLGDINGEHPASNPRRN